MDYRFTLPCKVRDYECDMQGIVNNSVYQNYLEHCRHEFLLSTGLSFAQLTRQGVHLVVTRVELDFVNSLKSEDEFWVGLNVSRLGRLRFQFQQDIYRSSDDQLMLKAQVLGTGTDRDGKLLPAAQLDALFKHWEALPL